MPSRTSRGYTAPVGLLGLMITTARVRSVIFEAMSAMSGGFQSEASSHA